jgi:hypothetical protein
VDVKSWIVCWCFCIGVGIGGKDGPALFDLGGPQLNADIPAFAASLSLRSEKLYDRILRCATTFCYQLQAKQRRKKIRKGDRKGAALPYNQRKAVGIVPPMLVFAQTGPPVSALSLSPLL